MGYRLSWRHHGDALDVALLANRSARLGVEVAWCQAPWQAFEAGDYYLALDDASAGRLVEAGFTLHPAAAAPPGARRVSHPATALLCGEVSAYPYFGFYTLCLLRLGFAYRPVSGADIAGGALTDRSLLVLPGGFATWGLDAGESAPGADARVRAFMDAGGGCIGSCGGAFYLSAGRPGWTGTLPVVPRWTHEYLQSGAAVVSVALEEGPLATGLPPTLELPYYHGPVYQPSDLAQVAGDNAVAVAGRFRAPCLPSRLMIDNPLAAERFARTHADQVAMVLADGLRGRAVLFSPHPEMGDLMRKYMALDGYVRHYLPVRGEKTMDETLRFYRPLESPAFRLVNNAVHWLDRGGPGPPAVPPARAAAVDHRQLEATGAEAMDTRQLEATGSEAVDTRQLGATGSEAVDTRQLEATGSEAVDTRQLEASALRRLRQRPADADEGMQRLLEAQAERVQRQLSSALARLRGCIGAAEPELAAAWWHAAGEAARTMTASGASPDSSRVLFDVELIASIADAAARVVELDRMLGER